jgi:MSHA pilin protein MshD
VFSADVSHDGVFARDKGCRRRGLTMGLTLIELLFVIVILGIALTITTQMVSRLEGLGANVVSETKAIELAQATMDTVMIRRFDEFSPVGGVPPCGAPSAAACTLVANFGPETTVSGDSCVRVTSTGSEATDCESTKTVYDDVDDFDGLDEGLGSAVSQAITNSNGSVRMGFENFRVTVAVTQPTGLLNVKRVVVTVFDPAGLALEFTQYKTNF